MGDKVTVTGPVWTRRFSDTFTFNTVYISMENEETVWIGTSSWLRKYEWDPTWNSNEGRYERSKNYSYTGPNDHTTDIEIVGERALILDNVDDKIYVYNTVTGDYVGDG